MCLKYRYWQKALTHTYIILSSQYNFDFPHHERSGLGRIGDQYMLNGAFIILSGFYFDGAELVRK